MKIYRLMICLFITCTTAAQPNQMQCQIDSDCGVGSSCRSVSGGGTTCIKRAVNISDRKSYLDTLLPIEMACQSDSDCERGASCRSKPYGGTFCKKNYSDEATPTSRGTITDVRPTTSSSSELLIEIRRAREEAAKAAADLKRYQDQQERERIFKENKKMMDESWKRP